VKKHWFNELRGQTPGNNSKGQTPGNYGKKLLVKGVSFR
jgi:hypothetical protein